MCSRTDVEVCTLLQTLILLRTRPPFRFYGPRKLLHLRVVYLQRLRSSVGRRTCFLGHNEIRGASVHRLYDIETLPLEALRTLFMNEERNRS